ncbi:cytochrome P450 [Jatrophihabitans fulvus]
MLSHETTGHIYPVLRGACPFDPPEDYVDIRESTGTERVRLWNGTEPWLVTRHADVRAVLADPRFSADGSRGLPAASERDAKMPMRRTFLRMDDPEHARMRGMLTREFTARRIEAMRAPLQDIADRFVDDILASGPRADLVEQFALPMPSLAMSIMLGVPFDDHDVFQQSTAVMMDMKSSADEMIAATGRLAGYLGELVARKQHEPGDDIISRLLADQVASGALGVEDLVGMCMLLIVAGHETTANMIAMGTLAILENPDQRAAITDAETPASLAAPVEELMRYLSVIENGLVRVATEDVEVGGALIRAGDGVIINVPAANRDPRAFEDPDRLDLRSAVRKHLGFGHGVHLCLGLTLARVEMQIAFWTLFHRLPGLRLAVPMSELAFRDTKMVYGIAELPVTY